MQPRKLFGAGLGIFFAVTIGVMWLQGSFARSSKNKVFTHMHCPKCDLEVAYSSTQASKPCPHCGPSGPLMIGTLGPRAENPDALGNSRFGNFIAASLIGLACSASSVYVWVLYARKQAITDSQVKNKPIVCRCPHCSRKIGYAAQKIGTTAVCPRCKTAFTLPDAIPEMAQEG